MAHLLQNLAQLLVKYPKTNILLALLVTVLVATQARQVNFDTTMVGFLELDNPHRIAYNNFKEQFGLSEFFIVVFHSDDVFEASFLEKLQSFEQQVLNKVPYVAKVESILTASSIREKEGEVFIAPLFESGISEAELKSNKNYALANQHFKNRLINPTATTTAMVIELQPFITSIKTQQYHMLLLDDVLDSYLALESLIDVNKTNFSHGVFLGGAPAAASELTKATKQDIVVFTSISIVFIALTLWLFFKSWVAVIAPLWVLIITATVTLSLMVIGQFPMQITSSMLPSFLLAVCIGDAVHLMQHYYRYLQQGLLKNEALLKAMNSTFTAMFFTTLTTSVGLLSFAGSGLLPIASFGLFTAVGVWLALLFTFLCVPAWLLLFDKGRARAVFSIEYKLEEKVRIWVSQLARLKILLIVIVLLLTVFAGFKVSQLSLSHDSLSWLDNDNPVRMGVESIDKNLNGTLSLELVIDTEKPQGIYDAAFIAEVDAWLESVKRTQYGKITVQHSQSLINPLKDIHKIVSPESTAELPQSNELLAQEILLLELDSAQSVSKYTDENYQLFRITLSTPWQDAVYYSDFLKTIEEDFYQQFNHKKLTVTGMASILNRTITEMLASMTVSYLIAAVLVTLVMTLLLRNIKMGLLMMLPNILPILLVLMVMSLLNLPLDMFTLLIGSIAIGLIVDDSVHLIYNFKKYYKATGRVQEALVSALLTAGSAMSITSVILMAGFLVYCFSYLNNLQNFGLLTALCILFALLADFIVAPVLILLTYKDNNNEKYINHG
jgi:predicted RND superfamily exporter protein